LAQNAFNAPDEEERSKKDESLVEVGEAAVLKEAGAAAGDLGAPTGLKCRFIKGRKSLSLTSRRWDAGETHSLHWGRPDHPLIRLPIFVDGSRPCAVHEMAGATQNCRSETFFRRYRIHGRARGCVGENSLTEPVPVAEMMRTIG